MQTRSSWTALASFGLLVWAGAAGAQTFETTWGAFGTLAGQFRAPRGATVDIDEPTKPTGPDGGPVIDCCNLPVVGNVYVADTDNNRIQKFDHNGLFLLQWGTLGSGTGQLNHPEGVAVRRNAATAGVVYVADTGNNRVHAFLSNGANFVVFGSLGAANGQFNSPQGIAARANDIYVADTNNNRIQRFDSLGTFVSTWGTFGNANGQFNLPQGVAVDASGFVYVIDTGNNRVQRFTNTGVFQNAWGTAGALTGQFNAPEGISAVGGSVFVADTGNNRIQRFNATGTFISAWGTAGASNGQFQGPASVAVNSASEVFVADTGNHRIQRFSLFLTGPTLGEWGTIALLVLIVGAGVMVFRRRQGVTAAS